MSLAHAHVSRIAQFSQNMHSIRFWYDFRLGYESVHANDAIRQSVQAQNVIKQSVHTHDAWTAMTLYNLTEDVRIFSVHICMITFCAWTDCVMTSLGMNWLRDYIMGMNCLRDYIMGMNWLHHGYELIVWLHSALELIVWLHHWHALIHNAQNVIMQIWTENILTSSVKLYNVIAVHKFSRLVVNAKSWMLTEKNIIHYDIGD
jgi:hypothetical protein